MISSRSADSERRFVWRNWLILFVLYTTTIVVFFVIPLGREFGSLLLGTAVYRHDAVLNAGILEWGFRSLWSSHLHFFDWPAGYPVPDALAGTENLLGWQLFYSPMRAAGATVAASYNVALVASLVVSGIGCCALARRYGASWFGAAVAGFAFAFNPFHLDHMIHLQTMAICWSPFAIMGLDIALERRSLRALVMLGTSVVMTVLCGMYFGVFLLIVLPAYALTTWSLRRFPFSFRSAIDLLVTGAAASLVLIPVIRPYLKFAQLYGSYPHTTAELALASLPLRALLQTPAWLATWSDSPLAGLVPWHFAGAFPGVVFGSLALIGTTLGRKTISRRANIVLIVIGVLCFLLAAGPVIEIQTGAPSPFLTAIPLPGKLWLALTAIRWPMRIFMYSLLCLAVFAGVGATWIESRISKRWRLLAQGLLMASMFVELRPATWFSSSSIALKDPLLVSDAYPFLARESDLGAVVELPSKMDSGLVTPFATRYAYASSGHLRREIAFHGSMFPPLLDSLRQAAYMLPDTAAIGMMKRNGVTRVVIHNDMMSADSAGMLVSAFLKQGDSIVFQTSASTVMMLKK